MVTIPSPITIKSPLESAVGSTRWFRRLRVPFDHAVMQLVAKVRSDEPLTCDDVDNAIAMLRRLPETRWKQRTLICWALATGVVLSASLPAITASLTEVLERSTPERIRRLKRRRLRAILRTLVLAPVVVTAALRLPRPVVFYSFTDISAPPSPFADVSAYALIIGTLLCLPALGFIFNGYDAVLDDMARAVAAWSLGKRGQPDCLSELVRATDDIEGRIARESAPAAIRVLARVTDANRNRVRSNCVPGLLALLRSAPADLQPTIIRGLGTIGSPRALPTLRRLAAPTAVSDGTESGRQAARDAIAEIERHVAEDRAARNLLRPSSAEELPNTALLRAATNAEGAPEQLLRPMT